LLLAFGAIVLAILVAMVGFQIVNHRHTTNDQANRLSSTLTRVLDLSLSKVSFSGKYRARQLVEEMASQNPAIAYIIVVDHDGMVFAASDPRLNDQVLSDPVTRQALGALDSDQAIIQDLDRHGVPVKEIASSFVSGYGDRVQGVVRVGLDMSARDADLRRGFILAGVLVTILATLALLTIGAVSRHLAAPVKAMAGTLQGILDHAPLAIHFHDRQGHINRTSARFREIFGTNPPEGPAVYGSNEDGEHRLIIDHEPRAFLTSQFPVATVEGEPESCTVAMDITEIKQLQEQLLQSQKMEAVGQLAGGVAHDFNNLLTAILGYSQMALEDSPSDSEARDSIRRIVDATHRATALTRDLLTFSRKRVIDPNPLDLNQLVAGIADMLKRLIGEHIKLEIDPALDPIIVHADPVQFEQVIVNLSTNARDAMPGGGTLSIMVSAEYLTEPRTGQTGTIPAGDYAVLSVADSGSGMLSDTMANAFEPFFTTKQTGHGTGLGLSMVYGIVKQHGGEIMVTSELDHGTTIQLYLPRLLDVELEAGPADEVVETGEGMGGETILVAEDEDMVRDYLTHVLNAEGYRVLTAADGEAAVSILEHRGEEVDLLLLDVIMPGLNGKEVRDAATRLHPGIPAIFMSGYTADIIHKSGQLDHGIDYIEKPLERGRLLKLVRGVMARGH